MALTTEIRLEFKELAQELARTPDVSEAFSMETAPEAITGIFASLAGLTGMFGSSASPDQTANLNAKPNENLSGAFKQSTWSAEKAPKNSEVSGGIKGLIDSVAARMDEAQKGRANIAAVEKDIKKGAAPDAKPDAGGSSVAGMGRGLAFDAAAVGAATLAAGPIAGAALGGIMMAKDVFSAVSGGSSSRTITLSKEEARDFKRHGTKPAEMRSAQSDTKTGLEQAAETGYKTSQAFNSEMSKGPGFGPAPQSDDLAARSEIAHDSLGGIAKMKLKYLEGQFKFSKDLKDDLDLRKDGIEISSVGELKNVSASNAQLGLDNRNAFVMNA